MVILGDTMMMREKAKKLLLNYNVLIKNNEEYTRILYLVYLGYPISLTNSNGGCLINCNGQIHLERFGSNLRGGTQESDITYWNVPYRERQPISVDTFLMMGRTSIKYNKDLK